MRTWGRIVVLVGMIIGMIASGQMGVAAAFNPTVSLSPSSGPAGTMIYVSGTGWSPNKTLTVQAPQFEIVVATSSNGSYSTQLTIPTNSPSGPVLVTVTEGCRGCGFFYPLRATFTVTAPSTTTSTTDSPVDPGPNANKGCFLGATTTCPGPNSLPPPNLTSPTSGGSATLNPPSNPPPSGPTRPAPTRGGTWVKPTTGHTYHVGDFVQFAATAYSSSGVDHVNFTIRPNIHEPHDWFIACPASAPVGATASDVFTCKWQVPAGIALGDAQIGFDVYDQAGNTNSPDGLRGITLAASPATFMQADTNDIYLVSGNTRFLIPDSDTLAAIALSPVITHVSPAQLNGFAAGATLYSIHNLPMDLQPAPTADSSAQLIDPSSGSTFSIPLPTYDDVETVYKALDILSNVLKVSECFAPDAIPLAGLIATSGASAGVSFSLFVINHSLNPVCLDLETWGAQQILGYDGPSYRLPPSVDENLMQIVPKRADE